MESRKGQIHKKYSEEFKKEILDKYNSGYAGSHCLAKEYGISHHTIDNWVTKQKKNHDSVVIDKRHTNSGNFKNKDIDYKTQVEILKKMEEFLKLQQETR